MSYYYRKSLIVFHFFSPYLSIDKSDFSTLSFEICYCLDFWLDKKSTFIFSSIERHVFFSISCTFYYAVIRFSLRFKKILHKETCLDSRSSTKVESKTWASNFHLQKRAVFLELQYRYTSLMENTKIKISPDFSVRNESPQIYFHILTIIIIKGVCIVKNFQFI